MKGIYIHIPFCQRKCNYCDFNSFSSTTFEREKYIEHLIEEIRFYSGDFSKKVLFFSDLKGETEKEILKKAETEGKGTDEVDAWRKSEKVADLIKAESEKENCEKIESVFIGGGTPSILSGEQLKRIIDTVFECFKDRMVENPEVTVESNPGTLDFEKLVEMKKAGVNRLSMGLQSANDDELEFIGRIHRYDDFEKSYFLARKAGFDNINVDLIFALPNQKPESWKNTLDRIIKLNPEHISAYSLIIEENTKFGELYSRGKIREVDEDTYIEMYRYTVSELEKNGYNQYEISNYAKDSRQCRHNIIYWETGEYLGIGLGSSGFVDGTRYRNAENYDEYCEMIDCGRLPVKDYEVLSLADMINERIILSLRMNRGLDVKKLEDDYGYDILKEKEKQVSRFISEGKIVFEDGFIKLTQQGREISNIVYIELMTD